ncbi:MAG: hypothetical protein R8G66_02450 [Cytophagales bacterium]|nr:hypothetical protein [Cytophagales bacterium]
MSNIAGKAYAMNLITPIYVKTSWLLLFFFPGILLSAKALGYFTGLSISLISFWPLGILFLLVGLACLGLGLTRWIGITTSLSPLILLTTSVVSFLLLFVTQVNLGTVILYGVFGILLLVVGFILLKNGVTWLNRFIFWLAGLKAFQARSFSGLETLSLIHYARWVILRDFEFPKLSADQPKEELKYGYMLFFSNFNGSWTQYVDSFSVAIAGGLNLLWNKNVGWKDANVETPFNGYVISNQIDTEYYYNAYPLASSNDVKSAKKVMADVISLSENHISGTADEFKAAFDQVILNRQSDLSKMEPTPIVSLAHEAIEKRRSIEEHQMLQKQVNS